MKKMLIAAIAIMILAAFGCSKKRIPTDITGTNTPTTPTATSTITRTSTPTSSVTPIERFTDPTVKAAVIQAVRNWYMIQGWATPVDLAITSADISHITYISITGTPAAPITNLDGLEQLGTGLTGNKVRIYIHGINTITSFLPLANMRLAVIHVDQDVSMTRTQIAAVMDYVYCGNYVAYEDYFINGSDFNWSYPDINQCAVLGYSI